MFKFDNMMEVPALLYGSDSWVVNTADWWNNK
jgi:hypothetical protein